MKRERLEATVDWLRRYYGWGTLRRSVTLLDLGLGGFDPRAHTIHPVSYFK